MAATIKLAKTLRRTLPTAGRFYSTARLLSSASSSSSTSITQQPDIPTVRCSPQPSFLISHSLLPSSSYGINPVRFNPARLCVNRPVLPPYHPGIPAPGNLPLTRVTPRFIGIGNKHWMIGMKNPGAEGATKQQMIDGLIQTLAKALKSEEEAKKKIYNVYCESIFGFFGCEVSEKIAHKMDGMPGVLFVISDQYVDPGCKDYGAELFVNGEIVQRSPERQARMV